MAEQQPHAHDHAGHDHHDHAHADAHEHAGNGHAGDGHAGHDHDNDNAGPDHGHAGHGHAGHHHAPANFDRAFAIGIGANILFVAIEAFYGWRVDSLALLAAARPHTRAGA